MARGWESKSIEDQIDAAQARRDALSKKEFTDSEIERRKRKEGLLLERKRILRERESAHKKRHLALLDRTLAHVEAELAKVEDAC